MQAGDVSPQHLSDDTGIGSDESDNQQLQPRILYQNHLNHLDPMDDELEYRPPKPDLYARIQLMALPHLNLTRRTLEGRTINFVTNAELDCSVQAARPLPLKWPDTRERIHCEIMNLDNQLLLDGFISNPVDWMLKKNLTSIPDCQKCNKPMVLSRDERSVKWHCPDKCIDVFAIVQRPTCFKGLDDVGLMRVLHCLYFWSISAPLDIVAERLQLELSQLQLVWKRIQRICKHALDKIYPRFKLFHNPEGVQEPTQPIDVIFIRFNSHYIVCGKHPPDNCVRLAIAESRDRVAHVTKNWFAHGARVRICQEPLKALRGLREDIVVTDATLLEMVYKETNLDLDSAFGYLVHFITNTFREHNSSTVTADLIKHILCEAEWRERFGRTPLEAFTNIVQNVSSFGRPLTHKFMPNMAEQLGHQMMTHLQEQQRQIQEQKELETMETYAEKYYYATVEPIDASGKAIRRYKPPPANSDEPSPASNILFTCHICRKKFESFDFTLHLIAHVDLELKDHFVQEVGFEECKHCFRPFKENELDCHISLVKMDLQVMKNACRICCIPFGSEEEFLGHMKKLHFKHETPYRCAKCPYASSFQRDVFVHHNEEHSEEYVVFCTICMRSFTLVNPEGLNATTLTVASEKIYSHIKTHYEDVSFSCEHCSLSFSSKGKLKRHKEQDHNPSELRPQEATKLEPFIVTREEEEFCVITKLKILQEAQKQLVIEYNSGRSRKTIDGAGSGDTPMAVDNQAPGLQLALYRPAGAMNLDEDPSLDTQTLYECLNTLRQMEGILPNDSVLITPGGSPVRCAECTQYVTIYHYLTLIRCQICSHVTHCPQASENHQVEKHPDVYLRDTLEF